MHKDIEGVMDIKNSWLFKKPIAHRGLHNSELPENSLGAIENAAISGYPIEIDIRITDDGEIVVFHDDKLTRMTNQDGYVCNYNAQTLKEFFLLKADGKRSDYTIPTFEDVLSTVNGKVPLLIELKNSAAIGAFENKVITMLHSYKGEYAVQSFNPYSLEYFKDNAPEVLRGQLSCFFCKNELSGFFKRRILKKLKLNKISKPDFVSYRFSDLPNKYVTKCNLPVLAWTIKSNADYEAAKQYCDNIIFEKYTPDEVE